MKRVLAAAFVLIAICLVAIFVLSKPSSAQVQACGPFRPLLDHLSKDFGESVVLTGDVLDKQVVVTMSSKGAFTIMVTDGTVACLVLAGDKAELDKGT